MKAYLYTGSRGKFIGVMESSVRRVMATSTQEVEVSIWSNTGPQTMNLRLSRDEASYLANRLIATLKEIPIVV